MLKLAALQVLCNPLFVLSETVTSDVAYHFYIRYDNVLWRELNKFRCEVTKRLAERIKTFCDGNGT